MAFSTKSLLFEAAEKQCLSGGDIIALERDEDFSLVIWFKTSYSAAAQYLISKVRDGGAGYHLRVETTGEIAWWMYYSAGSRMQLETVTSGLNDGKWHCCVVTHEAALGAGTVAACKVYIDGTAQLLNTVDDTLANDIDYNMDFRVGDANSVFTTFEGHLDEVAVYKGTVLDQAAVTWIYGSRPGNARDLKDAAAPAGLTAWWRMGESADGIEILEEALEVTYPAQHPPNTDPNLTTALYLNSYDDPDSATNGYNQNASFGNVTEMNFGPTDPFTLGIWVRTTDVGTGTGWTTTGSKTLFSKIAFAYYAGSDEGWRFYTTTGGRIGFVFGSSTSNYIAVATVDNYCDGLWRLLTVTYDGSGNVSGLKLFIDGVEVAFTTGGSGTVSGTTTTSQELVVGAAGTFGSEGYYHCRGLYCHSFGYDVALTPAEVALLYTDGRPQDLSGMAHSADLVHWCRLGDNCTISTKSLRFTTGFSYCRSNVAGILDFDYDEDFSLVGWFRTTDSGDKYLVSKMWPSSPYPGYRLMLFAGELYFGLQRDSTNYIVAVQTTDGPYNDDAWHHVVATWSGSATPDASDITIYVDGSPATTTVVNNSLDPPGSWSKYTVKFGNALDERAVVGDVLDHQWDVDTRTYSFWVKPNGGGGVLGKRFYASGHGLQVELGGGGGPRPVYFKLVASGSGRNLNVNNSTAFLNDGAWYHVAIVVPAPADASTVKTYVNGVSQTLTVTSNSLVGGDSTTTPGYNFVLGNIHDWSGGEGNLYLDEVAIFSSALSAGDVTALYNSGAPPNPTGLASWSSNIGYWRMGDGDTYPTLQDSGNGTSNDATMVGTMSADDIVPVNSILNDAYFSFGTYHQTGSNTFIGYLDEMAVYDKELSAAEVTAIYNGGVVPNDLRALSSDPNLVGWWRMGDQSDQTFSYNLYDYSQNAYLMKTSGASGIAWGFESPHNYGMEDLSPLGNDGRTYGVRDPQGFLSNTPPILYPTPYAPTTKSLDLNNDTVNEYVQFTDEPAHGLTATFTMGAWVKTTSTASPAVLTKGRFDYNSPGDLIRLGSAGGVGLWRDRPGTAGYIQWTGGGDFIPVNDGEWHFIAVVKKYTAYPGDGGGEFYIDNVNSIGLFKGTGGGFSYYQNGTKNVVGARIYGTPFDHFVGKVCHAFMYDRELTEFEVAEIRAGGVPQDLTVMGPTGNRVFWTGLGDGDTVGAGNVVEKAQSNDGTTVNVEAGDFVEDVPGSVGYAPLTKSIKMNDGVTNQHIEFGNVPEADFDFTDPFTFGVWVKAPMPPYEAYPVTARTDVLFMKHRTGGSDSGYTIGVDYRSVVPAAPQLIIKACVETATPGSWWGFTVGGWSNVYNRGKPWWDDVWHLVVVRWDGVTMQVWVDSQRRTESKSTGPSGAPFGGASPTADGKLLIGNHDAGSAEPCNETNACHAFIYNIALSAAEIREVYGEGYPQNLGTVGPTANLVFWSALGDGDAVGAGNVLDLSGNDNHGEFINGSAGDFVEDVPRSTRDLTRGGKDTWWNAAADNSADFPSIESGGAGNVRDLDSVEVDVTPLRRFIGGPRTTYYKMRARDLGAGPPGYVTWVSQSTPDFGGAGFSTGSPSPLGSMESGSAVIVAEWEE
jgi:hypothetical protein